MSLPLTKLPGVPTNDCVIPGMANFAGSGPAGKTCGDCVFRGYYRRRETDFNKTYKHNGCEKFKKLTGRHGPAVSRDNPSCKYFMQKPTHIIK